MPLHSIQSLPAGARLGLWHLQEAPADLWARLPAAAPYRALLPAPAGAARQAQWLAGRVLLHELLADFESPTYSFPTPPHLANDAEGRPYLVGWPAAAVSLSHSGEWVAALLAPAGRAGIDVEQVRDKARRLAGRFLAADELAAAQAPAADPAVFSLLWSAKETLYKFGGQRGSIFREDLLLDPAALPVYSPFPTSPTGVLPATLRRPNAPFGSQTRHRVCYTMPAPGYVLTYCHEPTDFPPISLAL